MTETTTAHSFTSIDPAQYPQRRRVVHSIHEESTKTQAARTRRVSRSTHAAGGGSLGSDFVENRIYRVKSVTPSGTAGLPPTSPLLSHTCTMSSSAAGDDSAPTSPAGRVNVQEVTLTYTREAGGASAQVSSSRVDGGTVEFSQRRRLNDGRENVPPYSVDRNGNANYSDYDDFLQITDDAVSPPLQPQEAKRQKPYTVPLRVETTTHARHARTVAGIGIAGGTDVHIAQSHRAIRFEDDAVNGAPQPQPASPLRQQIGCSYPNQSDMHNWKSHTQQQQQQHEKQERQQSSRRKQQQSQQQQHPKDIVGTKTSRMVYERTTSEMTMRKSTTTTTYRPKTTASGRPTHAPPPQPLMSQSGRQMAAFKEQTAYSPSGGLPRYHDDDIRLHKRYDDERHTFRNASHKSRPAWSKKQTDVGFTTFPPVPRSTTFEESSCPDNNEDLLLKKIPGQHPVYRYEYEEEDERYYERISSRGGGPAPTPASSEAKRTTPFGSKKNFSDATAKWRDVITEEEINERTEMQTTGRTAQRSSPLAYGSAKSQPQDQTTPMRLIDYDTYRLEVEQLQREASGLGPAEEVTDSGPVPLAPAIVLSPTGPTIGYGSEEDQRLKYFTKSELDSQTRVLSPSPPSEFARPTTSSPDSCKKAFNRKVKIIQMSPRFRPLVQEALTLEQIQRHPSTGPTMMSTRLVLQAGATASSTGPLLQRTCVESQETEHREQTSEWSRQNENDRFTQLMETDDRRATSAPLRTSKAIDTRELHESERSDFMELHQLPDSYRVASYTEDYEFRQRQERSRDRPPQRRPYYVEQATRQNIDISLEKVSLPRSRQTTFSDIVETSSVTTHEPTTKPMATFGVNTERVAEMRDSATMPHSIAPDAVQTADQLTQRSAAAGVDAVPYAASAPSTAEIGMQAAPDDAAGRELLETLRRELQYEELIDLEVRRRQRIVQEPDAPDVGREATSTVMEDLMKTTETVVAGEECLGATSEIKKNVSSSQPVQIEPTSSVATTASAAVEADEAPSLSPLTRTTDVPMNRIIGEYESRSLTPTPGVRQRNAVSQPPANSPTPTTGHTYTSRESSREYFSSSLSDYETRRAGSPAQRYYPQHQSRYSPIIPPVKMPRTESVSSTHRVTTFSPIAERDIVRPASAATTATLTSPLPPPPSVYEPRHPRVRSYSPLRSYGAGSSGYQSRMEYNSGISQRPHFLGHHRRAMSPPQFGHRTIKTIQSETSSMSSGLFSPYGGSTAASTIRDAREREKKEMSDLNDRLASYIEKVRFLEAQNRKLAADLEFLHNRWGKDTSNIREMYEVDIQQAQKLIDETNRQREDMKDTILKLEEEIANLRRKFSDAERACYIDKEQIDELLLKLSALEAEIALLKRRIAILEEKVASTKRENHRLLNELQHVRNDLDQQTLNRIDYQNQVQTLIEEIDFLRRAHDSEIHDLQAMASRDTTSENREYFRNELSSAIRDIRSEYDKVCNVQRVDMESWYKLKVQEIQTHSNRQIIEQSFAKEEIRRLRVQLGDLRGKLADLEGRNALLEKQGEELNYQLEDDQRSYESALNDRDSQIRKIRDECQMLMVELQMLLDTKQSLDAEIAIYRKMLDGEEDRTGLRQLLEQVTRTHHLKQSDETDTMRVLRGETSSRNSYQRSAKGNVAIREVAPDASFIIIENTNRYRSENIGEWRLRRRVDNGKRELHFTFPPEFVLGPSRTVKIWARDQGPYNPPDELVFEAEESFGLGNNVQNFLYNVQGEERASLIQRSNYTAAGH